MIHLQVACDPPEINPIHRHLHGLFTHRIGMALRLWLWRVSVSAHFTAPALTTRIIQPRFDLLSAFVAIWTCVHSPILPTSPTLDTPETNLGLTSPISTIQMARTIGLRLSG